MSNFDIYSPGDIFDSRDVIERLDELEGEEFSDLSEDEKQELTDLREFVSSADHFEDWNYGVSFIADDYFEDYARQTAEDLGCIDREQGWPSCHIDWEAAAESLQMDYTDVTCNGVTYWAR